MGNESGRSWCSGQRTSLGAGDVLVTADNFGARPAPPDGYASPPMQITKLNDVSFRPRRVAVGEFDGVHLGHRQVIEGSDTVLTFEPHPLAVIRPEAAPKLLTTLEVKAELVSQL